MEFKNCPFCGSDDISIKAMMGRRGWFVFAQCGFCGSQGKTYGHKRCDKSCNEECSPYSCDGFLECESVEKAVKAWNRRSGDYNG